VRGLVDHKHAERTAWATGDYDAMMRTEGLYGVGERLTQAMHVRPGEMVLDVACGTGNATIPAARAGADVTGLDLTPQLLAVAARRADEAGVAITWVEGDAEDLPFDDGSFDVVLSSFGCMFAPRHEVVVDELVRVLRPGGRLALVAWTPEGAIGDFFGTAAPHLPPTPAFVDPPLAWGQERYVRGLFEGTGVELRFARETWTITHDSVEAAVECYSTLFGPIAAARRSAEAEGRWPALRDDLATLFERLDTSRDTEVTFPAEYLVIAGTRDGSPRSLPAAGSRPVATDGQSLPIPSSRSTGGQHLT
jgi:SAM-dependent methyltransferase